MHYNEKWYLEVVDDYDIWMTLWNKISFANLMQSWEYGEAKKVQGLKPLRYIIKNEDGEVQGLLQVLYKGLPVLGGVARINRGPVYFKDVFNLEINKDEIIKTWNAIKRESRKQRWWLMFCMPETISINEQNILSVGFKTDTKKAIWGSIRLSLNLSEEELFSNLKGKWRNLLRKAQKLEVQVQEVLDKDEVYKLMDIYHSFQEEKNFSGIPSKLLKAMYEYSGKGMNLKVYQTFDIDNNLSGFVFISHHGDTANYLIGWTSNEGRRQQANYILLWHSIIAAKNKGLVWFDMGGVNENTTQGIKHFKEGINGEYYSLSTNFYKIY